MSYNAKERNRVWSLVRRAMYLAQRMERVNVRLAAMDCRELVALRWAIETIIESRGPLPEFEEAVRTMRTSVEKHKARERSAAVSHEEWRP